MDGALLLASTAGLMSALGWAEYAWHRRNLARVPLRVHVNGTRGKSAVTRLIAAGLRSAGVTTTAKTTGTLPRLILPDGSEQAIFRRGRANINEQLRIVRTAGRLESQALVLECMAVNPILQAVSEEKLVQATHGVITNVRADHLDVMGPTVRDVALSLAGSVPRHGVLFTAEQEYLDVLRDAARDRRTRIVAVDGEEIAAVSAAELEGFSYIEHAENVALALRVCADLGVDRRTALAGMWAATPDEGVMRAYEVDREDVRVVFVNGFAANDPQSTEQIWEMAIGRYPLLERRIAVVNCRLDRPDRSRQMAEMCARWRQADRYFVIGTGTCVFVRRAAALGVSPMRLTVGEELSAADVYQETFAWAGRSALAMGIGNIEGPGLELARRFREGERSTPRPTRREAA